MSGSFGARPTDGGPSSFVVEALGLGWTVGLALCTAVLFALYQLGLPIAVATVASLLCMAVVLGLGLRGLGSVRRADNQDALPEPRICEKSLAHRRSGVIWGRGRLARPKFSAGTGETPAPPGLPRAYEKSPPRRWERCLWERHAPPAWDAVPIAAPDSRTERAVLPAAAAGVAQPIRLGESLMVPIGLGLGLVQVVLSAWMAWRSPLAAFDAWSVWAFKARMFMLGGPRPGYFHAGATLHTHPDYPLNLPLAEAIIWRAAGALGPQLASLIGPICLAALLLLFYAGLSRLHGRATAALATAVLALIPALPLQAAGGDADVPLALYCGGAALYLLLWWRLRRPADAIIMALLAGGAAWTKKEGLTIAVALLLAYLIGERLRRGPDMATRLRAVVPVVVGWAALPLPWLIFTLLTHPLGRDFLPLTPAVFLAHAGRLAYIVPTFALQMLDLSTWSMLWVLLVALLALSLRRLGAPGYGLLLLLLAQLGAYALAFVFSDWQPYTAHVQTSLSRLLAQAAPLALLLLVECAATLSSVRSATGQTRQARAREAVAG